MSDRRISAEKVWNLAIQAKINNGWCDEGFNEAMSQLGFRPIETHKEYPSREGLPIPTPKDEYPCEMLTCTLCYNNAYPNNERRFLRYADGDNEIIREL